MPNLLRETLEILVDRNKTPEDVEFVSVATSLRWTGTMWCMPWSELPAQCGPWEAFVALADVEYDNDFGGQEVHDSLKIVFTDGSWLERAEYDGSEWWVYNETPKPPPEFVALHNLLS